MPGTRPPYPPEFREQIVALYHAGRTVAELTSEFEPSGQTIRAWVAQDSPHLQADTMAQDEREELKRLRKEVRQLRLERETLSKAERWFGPQAWFARESNAISGSSSIRESEPGHIFHQDAMPCARRFT